jgi:hypothetical protein
VQQNIIDDVNDIIASDADADAIEREESDSLTQDMADYFNPLLINICLTSALCN